MKFPRVRLSLSSRGLRVGFAVLSGVFVSVPLLRCNTVRAAADDLDSYQLTVPQTLGLYGDSLQAVYFDGAATTPVQFDYIGSTADISSLEGYPVDGGRTYLSEWTMREYVNYNSTMFQNYNFLIYKWDANSIANPEGSSFSVKLEQSLNLTAYGFKTSLFFSTSRSSVLNHYTYGQYTFYGDDLQTVIGDAVLMDDPLGYNDTWGILRTIPRPVTNANTGAYIFSHAVSMSFSGAYAFLGHTTDGYDPITIGSSYFATKDEGTVAAVATYDNLGQSYTFYDSAVYLLVQCPILYGDYILPEPETPEGVDLSQIEEYLEQQGNDIANISEEATIQTRQLISILAKLEQIYNSMPTASAFQTIVNNQTTGILSGIQGLFVPSQSDIIAFDTNMRNLIATTFLGVSDAKEIVDDSFEMIGQQTAAQTVDLPLIDLRSTGVNFYTDPQTLSNAGLTVSNGKIKVPIKPRSSEWGTFYEIAAYAIDIIATIAFINMLLNRMRALLVGEKVVEIDGN